MINVGVIGLGMMGLTHLDAYAKRQDVKVWAVSDRDPDRRSGKTLAAGNVEGQAQGTFDFALTYKYEDGMDLIRDPRVDLVDICLPTPMHVQFAVEALRAGKHVLVEKPLARESKDAYLLADVAARAKGLCMTAMCMRFWPGWTWLKEAINSRTYGKVLAAQFRRVASHPGGAFYSNGELSGGAALDLHVHDSDFIQYCFGMPEAVTSFGYSKVTSAIDHLITRYHYEDGPLVTAEGGWVMAAGFPFRMQYTVNFDSATAVYDSGAADPLMLYEPGKAPAAVPVDKAMGYELEIAYFLDCVQSGRQPRIVTVREAADTLRLVEAEVLSARTGKTVEL